MLHCQRILHRFKLGGDIHTLVKVANCFTTVFFCSKYVHQTRFGMATASAIERLEFRVLSGWIVWWWWEKAGTGLTGNGVLCLSQSGWFCPLPHPTQAVPLGLLARQPLNLIRPQIKGSRALLMQPESRRQKLEMVLMMMLMTLVPMMVMMMTLMLGSWELVRSGDGSAEAVTESPLTLHCTV